MSFLFGKKKQYSNSPTGNARDGQPSNTPSPAANGVREREKPPGGAQSVTPGSSLNSNGGGATPSPEHRPGSRTSHEQDNQLPSGRPGINGHAPSNSGPPNANLYPWSKRRLNFTTTQPNPFPRYGAAVNSTSSKEGDIYVMGGLVNGSIVKGDLWMIEAGVGNLACYPIGTKSEGPGPRVGHASLLVGNAFIVFGGDTKQEETDPLDDTLYLLNTSTRVWSRALPPGPRPAGRYGHTLNILGSKIYVFGGQVDGHFFNDLVAFDLNALQDMNNCWETLIQDTSDGDHAQGMVPLGRTNHTIVTYNDKLYLFGGTDGIQWFNDVWTYDPRTNVWGQLDCIGYIPQPREGHSAALVNDVMYIFGGRTQEGNDLGDLAAFRITSRRWYTFQNMGPSPSPRSGHSMTAYGQQIVVLAGEPSSTPRDPSELSLVYILDTAKIRYPNDQQAQPPPLGERVPGSRRPSQDKSGIPQAKGMYPRDGSGGPFEGSKRLFGGPKDAMSNEPIANNTRVQDTSIANGSTPAAPGSRLPRAASASGPPPLQQAPPPRTNGVVTSGTDSRSRTPTRDPKGFGPPIDTTNTTPFDRQDRLPNVQEVPRAPPPRAMSPATNIPTTGRPTPNPQMSRLGASTPDVLQSPPKEVEPTNLQTRQAPPAYIQQTNQYHPNPMEQQSRYVSPTVSDATTVPNDTRMDQAVQQDNVSASQLKALNDELNVLKSKNIWYASELALAKKAGYTQDSTLSPTLNEKTLSVGDNEKPLVEALIAMKTELAEVQSSVESRVKEAAQMVAEVEQQRDAAIREAAYAKAKLAAHGGSQAGTPQLDDSSRDITDPDRSIDLNRRLASALGLHAELHSKVEALTTELSTERRAREIAEDSTEAANKRVSELEKSRDPGAVESLKAELHEAQRISREETATRMEADARARLLEVDVADLKNRLDTTSNESKKHLSMLTSLRDAITASQAKSAHLERKLDEEREQREAVQRKLLQLRSEHEERTSELESTSRKLRDAEELAEKHANEAQLHRSAVLSGFDKLASKPAETSTRDADNQRVAILQQQVVEANALVRKNQADADSAAEKLRRAEERIAGLEAYQEQSSRESLGIRRQLQEAIRTAQSFQTQHSELKRQLESHQRDANAISVQHSALKDLLDERPVISNSQNRSRGQGSPAERQSSPDAARLRDLEQKLSESVRAHEDTKSSFAEREQSSEKQYRDKLEQLEQDYQSAVSYVKGTEKMLKRMKDELSKSKASNARLQAEVDKIAREGNGALDEGAAANWEAERQALRKEIEEMQANVKGAVNELERQMQDVKTELRQVQEERDHWRVNSEQMRKEMDKTTRQQRETLEQLKAENRKLESRAEDAETKVGLLLDQVGSSVDAYRRQSANLHSQASNGIPSHNRDLSTNSTLQSSSTIGGHSHSDSLGNESSFSHTSGPDQRNSLALDSLASELETLRTQWEGTHRTYRLSSQFEFERSPPPGGSGVELSDSLANWRRRLDDEERGSPDGERR